MNSNSFWYENRLLGSFTEKEVGGHDIVIPVMLHLVAAHFLEQDNGQSAETVDRHMRYRVPVKHASIASRSMPRKRHSEFEASVSSSLEVSAAPDCEVASVHYPVVSHSAKVTRLDKGEVLSAGRVRAHMHYTVEGYCDSRGNSCAGNLVSESHGLRVKRNIIRCCRTMYRGRE